MPCFRVVLLENMHSEPTCFALLFARCFVPTKRRGVPMMGRGYRGRLKKTKEAVKVGLAPDDLWTSVS